MRTRAACVFLALAAGALTPRCSCEEGEQLVKLVGELTVSPVEISFGTVDVFSKTERTVTLRAVGTRSVVVDKVRLETPSTAYEIDTATVSVRLGEQRVLQISFEPTESGSHDNTLLIGSDADVGGELRVILTGRAIDPCVDGDGDTFGEHCRPGPDCRDDVREIHPGAPERCNSVDDDCDEATDEGFGIGDPCAATFNRPDGTSCVIEGTTVCAGNEEETSCELFDAEDVCDGVDNDCNGTVDDPFPLVGAPCYVPQGDCRRAGTFTCTPDGMSAECMPDPNAPLECCPAGQEKNPSGECCTLMPTSACAVECNVDVEAGTHDCAAPIQVTELSGSRGTMTVDLTGLSSMAVGFEICDPTGFALHVSDSPSANGHGGDGGDFANDAELHFTGSGNVVLVGNDYAPATSRSLLSHPGFVPAQGCSQRTILFADQVARCFEPCFEVQSEYSLRLDPPADQEGTPDSLWYLGLNRVHSGTSRTGTGLRTLHICLR